MNAKWLVNGALAIMALVCPCAAQSVPELLEKGIYMQETVGDLDRAIEIYRQVLSSTPSVRAHAALAHYRLAQCLLQKGAELEAAREFRKVIEGYPEEKDLVERARESILPLADTLDADYSDPVFGLSFTAREWPVSKVYRNSDGSVTVALSDRFNPPYRVFFPTVDVRRSKLPSVQAWWEEYHKGECRGCTILSVRELNGWQVLSCMGPWDYHLANGAATMYSVLVKSGKTEVRIRVGMLAQDLEHNQAIVERILESMRMP